MVAKKKKSTKKARKPKVVYKTKVVVVERKVKTDSSPMEGITKQVMPMVGLGMGTMIGMSVAGAVSKSLKSI